MSWLLVSALGIAGAAAVAVAALHFIARSRPLAEPLPTARFIPDRPIQARTRSTALSDILLLLMRIVAIAAIGIAVAGPIFSPGGRIARVFLLDRSRAVANVAEARDSVRALARPGEVVVIFDSAAVRTTDVTALDSVVGLSTRGSISAALAAGIRAAVRAAADADSVELVLVSPLVAEEVDDATPKLRASWPGRIRLVQVGASAEPVARPSVELPGLPDDAIVAGLSLMGVGSSSVVPSARVGANAESARYPVRLVRSSATSADSVWARESGRVLLHWPASDAAAVWPRRTAIDAIGGVSAKGATLVARFPRLWHLDGDVVARWADGEPAAIERATGGGCIRDVGVVIDQAGDLTLRTPFRRFASIMLEPCGGARDLTPADSSVRAALLANGPLASAAALRSASTTSSQWTPWLLALAALLLTGELAYRRPDRGAA